MRRTWEGRTGLGDAACGGVADGLGGFVEGVLGGVD